MQGRIAVVGGGLAGSEAAWQIARSGLEVDLFEMRPARQTPAHKTGQLGELVCSNSLKSDQPGSAPFLLKEEMKMMHSLVLDVAARCRVPAGAALAVDRDLFAAGITEAIEADARIHLRREEVCDVPDGRLCIIATGPLTSQALADSIRRLTGEESFYFYDAISPVVEADSIDLDRVFRGSRYGKGSDDYINCPMTEQEYDRFYQALIQAESVPVKEFEKAMFFEGCLPIEELARRGRLTLAFGPMKPTGLVDPRTGRRPFAVVQLRQENLLADAYNMVGFQNHLRYGEQQRIFRLIPGLEKAEFIRLGQIHRNTFINAPRLLRPTLQLKSRDTVFFAGQICGVEGYVESAMTGIVAGRNAARIAAGLPALELPRETACGSLIHYLMNADASGFQPMNITFGLLPPLEEEQRRGLHGKKDRQVHQVQRALEAMRRWLPVESSSQARAPAGSLARDCDHHARSH